MLPPSGVLILVPACNLVGSVILLSCANSCQLPGLGFAVLGVEELDEDGALGDIGTTGCFWSGFGFDDGSIFSLDPRLSASGTALVLIPNLAGLNLDDASGGFFDCTLGSFGDGIVFILPVCGSTTFCSGKSTSYCPSFTGSVKSFVESDVARLGRMALVFAAWVNAFVIWSALD